jgi:hypothetical protein
VCAGSVALAHKRDLGQWMMNNFGSCATSRKQSILRCVLRAAAVGAVSGRPLTLLRVAPDPRPDGEGCTYAPTGLECHAADCMTNLPHFLLKESVDAILTEEKEDVHVLIVQLTFRLAFGEPHYAYAVTHYLHPEVSAKAPTPLDDGAFDVSHFIAECELVRGSPSHACLHGHHHTAFDVVVPVQPPPPVVEEEEKEIAFSDDVMANVLATLSLLSLGDELPDVAFAREQIAEFAPFSEAQVGQFMIKYNPI